MIRAIIRIKLQRMVYQVSELDVLLSVERLMVYYYIDSSKIIIHVHIRENYNLIVYISLERSSHLESFYFSSDNKLYIRNYLSSR